MTTAPNQLAQTRVYQLDGLRAVAVLMVFLFHEGLIRSGWIGVDIFFVLSGFLITGILRRSVSNGDYWRSFYVKRATRILPPLLLVLVAVLPTVQHFRPAQLGYLFFASNIVQLTPCAIGSLAALWSLAIEEHFYLVWPFAVKRLTRQALLKLSIGLVLVSPILRAIATMVFQHLWGPNHHWNNPIFLLTPFRLDGLAAGAALALLVEDDRQVQTLRRWSGPIWVVVFSLFFALEILFPGFRRTADTVVFNSVGYSMVVTASFALVAFLILNSESLVARAMALSPLVFIGTISYGFYLFQNPVKAITRALASGAAPGFLQFLIDAAVTVVLATMSFHLFEKHFTEWGRGTFRKAKEAAQSAARLKQEEGSMVLRDVQELAD